MRRWFQAALVLSVLAFAPAARAGFIVEASLGKGVQTNPSPVKATPTNIMIAPGVTFLSLLRLELGLVTDLGDAKTLGTDEKKFNLQLRPMLVVAPPIFPLYGRAIFAVTNLLHGKTTIAYGAAAGFKLGVGPVGVFAEAGLLPRSIMSQISWVIEGRLGVNLEF